MIVVFEGEQKTKEVICLSLEIILEKKSFRADNSNERGERGGRSFGRSFGHYIFTWAENKNSVKYHCTKAMLLHLNQDRSNIYEP